MAELDNLEVKILTRLQNNGRKPFLGIEKHCLNAA